MKNKRIILIIIAIILIFITIITIQKKSKHNEESDYILKLSKQEISNSIKFNQYLERDEGRIIYTAGNIDEIYFYEKGEKNQTLKEYSKTWQSLDSIIKDITKELSEYATLRDGGTKIYKSKSKDITLIVCHTVAGNKDIFIGDYNMDFDNESMCQR